MFANTVSETQSNEEMPHSDRHRKKLLRQRGSDPARRFIEMRRVSSSLNPQIFSGNLPDRWLLFNCRSTRRRMLPRPSGIMPDNFCSLYLQPRCFKRGCLQFYAEALFCALCALLHSFGLFCALLHSFADLRLRSFPLICALLLAFACFCVQLCLERLRLGTADSRCETRSLSKSPLCSDQNLQN